MFLGGVSLGTEWEVAKIVSVLDLFLEFRICR